MIYAYVRVSTETQSVSSQHFEIDNWARKEGWTIDKWIEESVSGTVEPSRRKLGRSIKQMKKGDVLICTEISRLGRNMLMIMSILNDCASRGIRLRTIKDNLCLDSDINSKIIAFAFALAAEIERNLISQRTREALADLKASGARLGRPPGSCKARDEVVRDISGVKKRLNSGETMASVARHYGVHRNTLAKYLKETKTI